ncbi:M50 family metallopeptidase [Brachybacterium sp. DNPG3]
MTALLFALGILVVAAGLALSIALHEIGHLLPAKLFGVKVTQYMIGFGPTVWSRRRGETEYGVKAIPLGGYIRMIGMYPPHKGEPEGAVREDSTGFFQQMADEAKEYESSQYDPADRDRTFVALSVLKKLAVMLGGPTMNLLIAIVLITVLACGFGMTEVTPRVQAVSECVVPVDAADDTTCEGREEAPALAAGIEPGDVLLEIGGHDISTWDDVTAAVRASGGETIDVVVERDGQELTLQATPIIDARPVYGEDGSALLDEDGAYITEDVGFLGVSGTPALVRQSPTAVPSLVWDAFSRTGQVIVTLPVRLYDVAQAAFGSAERDPEGPVGVVGVSRLAGEIASADQPGFALKEKAATLISMLASLNMALFVFNLVPLLPLDGGHVLGALIEGVRRMIARLRGRPDPGPVDISRMLPLTNAVALVFVAMTILLVYADIVRPITLF